MSMSVYARLLRDLDEESAVVDGMLAGLGEADWERPTPAVGWAVRDQVSHLAFFDEQAVLAVKDATAFKAGAQSLLALGPDFPDHVAVRYRPMPVPDLLAWFRSARAELLDVFAQHDGKTRVPWFGPDMNLTSSATARLMETWAHGLDIAETIGADVAVSDRLHHVAHLGVRTRGFSFALRERPVPTTEVRVELTAPTGGTWTWGPTDGPDLVRGSALDFCLVVTQRRHVADTGLEVRGAVATEWLSIAQAFAGAPSDGRAPQHAVGVGS